MSTLLQFVRDLLAFGRWTAVLAVVMLAGLGLTEGLSLLLLVELVSLVGLDVHQGTLGAPGRAVAAAFQSVGLLPTLPAMLAAYVAVVGVRGVLERRQTLVNQRLDAGFASFLRGRLYRALTRAEWAFHARRRVADSVHALTNEADRAGAAGYYVLQMAVGAMVALVYVVFALWTAPLMTMVVIACGGVVLVTVRRSARAARSAGERYSSSSAGLYRSIGEHFSGMKTAKSYGAEERHVAAFEAVSREVVSAMVRAAGVHARVRQRLELGSVVLMAGLVYVAHEVLAVPIGQTFILVFLFARLMPRVNGLLTQATGLLEMMPAYRNIRALEARCEVAVEDLDEAGASPVVLADAVRLDQVTYAYEGRDDRPALRGLSLTIAAGETTAVVGPSGAGKSTLADMVIGLIQPQQGRMLVDGVVLDRPRLRAWRAQIGYVSQDTFLFHDTIRANLTWASPGRSEDELQQALALAAADEFVARLPHGLETVVGDRGVLLSGGERQRLALARALLRRPRLLILDEATSALDAENEARILSAVDGLHGHTTILIITHRLSAVRGADAIHVLEDGRLVESGSWDRLVGSPSRFRELCDVQGVDVVAELRTARIS